MISRNQTVCRDTLCVWLLSQDLKLWVLCFPYLWLAAAKYIRAFPRYEPVPSAWLAVSSHPHSLFSPSTTGMAGCAVRQKELELLLKIRRKELEPDYVLILLIVVVVEYEHLWMHKGNESAVALLDWNMMNDYPP